MSMISLISSSHTHRICTRSNQFHPSRRYARMLPSSLHVRIYPLEKMTEKVGCFQLRLTCTKARA